MNLAHPTPDDPDPRCVLCPRSATIRDDNGTLLRDLCADIVAGVPHPPAPAAVDSSALEASFWGWWLATAFLLLLGGLLLFSLPGWTAYP